MLRSVVSALKSIPRFGSMIPTPASSLLTHSAISSSPLYTANHQLVSRNYSICTLLGKTTNILSMDKSSYPALLQPKHNTFFNIAKHQHKFERNIKFSFNKGKRRTMKSALQKFYRLDWGCWIHGRCGRHKRLYKKSANRRRRLQYHVFCNGRQNYLLDRMVTKYWRTPKYYVDDPYEPYQTREEFKYTRMKPYQPFLN